MEGLRVSITVLPGTQAVLVFPGAAADRLAVAEVDLIDVPAAPGCAAAQRPDLQLDLVAGLEGLARPAAPHQVARAGALEVPRLGAALLVLYRQDDESVRIGELELLDYAFEQDRIVLIEHREGVMSERRTAYCDER